MTRTCSIPEDKALFFPVVNSITFNTPNVCGQGPADLPIRELRATSAEFIKGVANLSVELDGNKIERVRHVRSELFEVALPEDNVFDSVCAVPARIYSPSVDEGFYVLLHPLKAGNHLLTFHAENTTTNFIEEVTYTLAVVPVQTTRPRQD